MKNKAHRAQYGKRIGVLLFIGTSLNFLKSKPLWSRGKYCWIQITCRSPKENFPPRYHFQWLMDPSMKCGPIYDQKGIILPQNLLNVKKKKSVVENNWQWKWGQTVILLLSGHKWLKGLMGGGNCPQGDPWETLLALDSLRASEIHCFIQMNEHGTYNLR